jgi:hypothetical protein
MNLGWNEHGYAVMTGTRADKYIGRGDLQDAENCRYSPASVLSEMCVDYTYGDPEDQYNAGNIHLEDGTILELGGTFGCVWAITRGPMH